MTHARPRPRRRGLPTTLPAIVRDLTLLTLGAGVVVHETVIAAAPRWELLIVAGAVLGVRLTLPWDRRDRQGSSPSGQQE